MYLQMIVTSSVSKELLFNTFDNYEDSHSLKKHATRCWSPSLAGFASLHLAIT